MTPREILLAAGDLVEREDGWTKGWLAYTASGEPVDPSDPAAFCFCAIGAIRCVAGTSQISYLTRPDAAYAYATLSEVVGGMLNSWNDAPERTQAEVVSAFRKAADLCEA